MRLGHGVEPAYFSQHEVELDERGSVLEATMGATGLCGARTRRSCSAASSSRAGTSTRSRSSVLSGGERRRLALALVVASGANFLVLDEPTNHLDLESREALEAALEAFPGTVLLVSHDRALLDAVVGPRARDRGRARSSPTPAAGPSTCAASEPPSRRRRSRSSAEAEKPAPPERPAGARPSLELVEREIAAREERVAELERQLAEDWTNVDLVAAHRAARDDLEALLARWESLFEERSAPERLERLRVGRHRDHLLPAAVAERDQQHLVDVELPAERRRAR